MSINTINIGFEYAIIIITPIYGEASAEGASKNFGKEKKYKIADFEKKSIKKYESKKKYKKKYKSIKKV